MLFINNAFVSIHDVMPENLNEIGKIICFLNKSGVDKLTLLIVPGKEWADKDIEKLKNYEKNGLELAGHGWTHVVKETKGFYHKLHSKLLSRNEAEHLSISENEILNIIKKSYLWFKEVGLKKPDLYVPPAWAIGKIHVKDLVDTEYRFLETGFGVHDLNNTKFYPMPVTGYMADTCLRVKSLKIFNLTNVFLPFDSIRLSIHPFDLNYPLLADLKRHLRKIEKFLSYSELGEDKNFQNKIINKNSFNHKKNEL